MSVVRYLSQFFYFEDNILHSPTLELMVVKIPNVTIKNCFTYYTQSTN